MGRGLVAVGYAIGAGLVLAHRRGRIPKPFFRRYDNGEEYGGGVTWFGVEAFVLRRRRARGRG